MPPTLGRLDGLAAGPSGSRERRQAMLSLSGGGYRAALFHLGALTRLNELGLLAKVDVVGAVSGGSILAALLAARVPWPLSGAYRDWPEEVAAPMREIARRNARARAFLRSPISSSDIAAAALEERYARELIESLGGAPPERPRFVFGGAGLVLGEMGVDAGTAGPGGLHWEIGTTASPAGYDAALVGDVIAAVRTDLDAFGVAEQAVLENHGYLLADAAVRGGAVGISGIEPLPPEPPHPYWMDEERARSALAASSQQTRLGRLRPRRVKRLKRIGEPATPELTALLERHRPCLQYDSLESYRADSVALMTAVSIGRRSNTLHRGDGKLIAAVTPTGGEAELTLDFLSGPSYSDGRPSRADDYLDECGGTHAVDAGLLRQRAEYADVVYGRGRHDGEGRLWLQYWFFYYFNDKGLLGAGLHEGDWEMVQLRLDADGAPDAVTYGQHSRGQRADWAAVEQEETADGPVAVVYPARGSHASRLRAGSHPAPVLADHNDGLGPRLRPRLVTIADDGPGWVLWPGRWGSTRRREAFESDSPRGPRAQRQWWDPAAFHRHARPAPDLPQGAASAPAGAPPAPSLSAWREGDRAILEYSFPSAAADAGRPGRIVAGACDDSSQPPLSQSFMTEDREGSLTLQIPPGASPNLVRASAAAGDGTAGETVVVALE